MTAEVFTGDVSSSLGDLAATAISEYRLACASALNVLDHAIACGTALLEAQQLVKRGDWCQWCADNVPEMSMPTISKWCRIAAYKDLLPAGETAGARHALRLLQSAPSRKGPLSFDLDLARRLRQQGMTYPAIGAIVGVTRETVAIALDPARRQRRIANIRQRKAALREGRAALDRQERDRAIRKLNDPASYAYVAMRKVAPVVDQASRDLEKDAAYRQHMCEARSALLVFEDAIGKALRV